ncbi:Aste57867_1810 [Aphanomyces stellatus]|uniref:Aste57867_1810 protein n=1 Tax=Aphanomyces stellatus TaxID=120398 RepID=A0A485K9L0_9STRA|nr:hypothetical protein As57867_001808 [Aphanomyces stellatus]VFT79019.1 Aste57867_1810 [Aphanomyces stellatus]
MSVLTPVRANAATAWSPVSEKSNLFALGSPNSDLHLVSLDFSAVDTQPTVVGHVATAAPFRTLAWSPATKHQATHAMGILAGGLEDGTVAMWDPSTLGQADTLSTVTKHKGAVTALQFNPNKDSSHLLASGGADGEVWIISLNNVESPAVFAPGTTTPATPGNEITSLAWNTTASYILAAGSLDGRVTVWDLKQKKPCFEVQEAGPVSALAWSPDEGFLLMTASLHSPVIRVWDLRASNTVPLVELYGHLDGSGILSVAWCPHDSGLLVSTGTDNRTLLWDLKNRHVTFEIPSVSPRSHLAFSRQLLGLVVSTAADGSVQVLNVGQGGASHVLQWTPRGDSAVDNYGYHEEQSSYQYDTTQVEQEQYSSQEMSLETTASSIHHEEVASEAGFHHGFEDQTAAVVHHHEMHQAMHHHETMQQESGHQETILQEHVVHEETHYEVVHEEPHVAQEQQFTPVDLVLAADLLDQKLPDDFCDWKLSLAMVESERQTWSFLKVLFEHDARKQLLVHLGFESTDDVLASTMHDDCVIESGPLPVFTTQAEDAVKRSLLVGNFEAAVDLCLEKNQLANALLLATCGGPDLWHRTQEAFFKRQTRPFMKIVAAIIKNELDTLVQESDPLAWKETLAILSTYSKSDEFPGLCDQLAWRLVHAGDLFSASLCFVCAMNMDKTIELWTQLNPPTTDHALQLLVEKISVFAHGTGQSADWHPPVYAHYATLMTSLDRPLIARKYAGQADQPHSQRSHSRSRSSHRKQAADATPNPFEYKKAAAAPLIPSPAPGYEETTAPSLPEPVTAQPAYSSYEAYGGDKSTPAGYGDHDHDHEPTPYTSNTYEDQPPYSHQSAYDHQPHYEPAPYEHSAAADHPPAAPVAMDDKPQHPIMHDEEPPSIPAPPLSQSSTTSGSTFSLYKAAPARTALPPPPPAAQPSAEKQPFVRTPEMANISEQDIAIVEALVELLTALEFQKLPPAETKALAEAVKAKDILVAKLNGGDLADAVVHATHDMALALQRRDFKAAQLTHVALTASHWATQKEWLRGLKAFFQLCLKRLK